MGGEKETLDIRGVAGKTCPPNAHGSLVRAFFQFKVIVLNTVPDSLAHTVGILRLGVVEDNRKPLMINSPDHIRVTDALAYQVGQCGQYLTVFNLINFYSKN
jgi:hypothetical protein